MSSFPQTTEELSEFFEGFLETYTEQYKTPGDLQQGPCFPHTATADWMLHRDLLRTPEGYQPFHGHQVADPGVQINHYELVTSSSSSRSDCRGQGRILGGESTLGGCQTSAYRASQYACMDPQKTSPTVAQPLYGHHMYPPGFDKAHAWSVEKSCHEDFNLSHCAETTVGFENLSCSGLMETTCVDESIWSSQKAAPDAEGSHSWQRTSFCKQSPGVGKSTLPCSSKVRGSAAMQSISVSPTYQGQLLQEKSDMETHSHVTQEKPPTLKFFCPFQDCEKSYTKSYHLKDHIKKHRGEKAFVCKEPGCQWSFFRPEDLRRHQRKHSGERLYPCDKCTKNFSRLNYLKQHQRVCTQAGPSPGE